MWRAWRIFVEVSSRLEPTRPLAVDLLLAAVQKLYRIETRANALGLSLEARRHLRQQEAQPIFMEVGQLIATLRKDVLPKSPLGARKSPPPPLSG